MSGSMPGLPTFSALRTLVLVAVLAVSYIGVQGQVVSRPDSAAPRIVILPFQNLSPESQARDAVMPRIYQLVAGLGLCPVSADTVDAALRRFRIRDTGQIGWKHAQGLSSENGSQWIMLGSIDLYSSDLLQAGISARLLNGLTGEIVWADSRYAAANKAPSLLRPNPIDSVGPVLEDVLQSLFVSLEQAWLQNRCSSRTERAAGISVSGRVLIIPWENISGSLLADQIVNHVVLSMLFQHGFDIIEPGLVNEQTRSLGLMPQGQVDLATLKSLADYFAADYCLTGSVIRYELATLSEEGNIPALEISMRWLDARLGRILGSVHIGGSGADFIKIFQLGAIRSPGQLLQRLLAKPVMTISKQLALRNS